MQQYEHNGLKLEYEIKGRGVPFVFLHGLGGDCNQINSIYEPQEDVQLITINQQGHGKSEVNWENYDFYNLADDVIALLDILQISKAVFAGISMGAAVALNLSCRYPERVEKLLLIRNAWTSQPMGEYVQLAYRCLGDALEHKNQDEFERSKGGSIIKNTSPYTIRTFRAAFQNEASIINWKKYSILPGKTSINSIKELEKLCMSVSIIANKNDFCHPFEYGQYLYQHIKNAEFIEIPDKDADEYGHKQKINEIIKEMLKEKI